MEHTLTLQINQLQDDLDAGDTATDSFTYTISDGTDTDTATLVVTVTGVSTMHQLQ
jgi:VCBS repeat-containing protein